MRNSDNEGVKNMKCNTLKLTEQDQFINKIKNSESQITSFL